MVRRFIITFPIGLIVCAILSFTSVERIDFELGATKTNWLAVLPPLVAIVTVVITRWLIPSLILGIATAALVHSWPSASGFVSSLFLDYLWNSVRDSFHMSILGFTAVLIGMVKVTCASGGTRGILNAILRLARGRQGVSVTTVAMGFVVFFDDYANTAIVGPMVRPLFDKLKLSREKLAYLIDSTAAPIAGLALVSTWIGTEVSYLRNAAADLGLTTSGYSLFLSALGYRFYCIFALVLVWSVAVTGRDFGPMLRAERRALVSIRPTRPIDLEDQLSIPARWYNAALPVGGVIVFILVRIFQLGSNDVGFSLISITDWREAFVQAAAAGEGSSLSFTFLYASLLGSFLAITLPAFQGILPLKTGLQVWFKGMVSITGALAMIVCAWALSAGCRDVETANYAVTVLRQGVGSQWIPLTVFVTAGLVAFGTGTSWGTMAIVIPTAAQLGYEAGGEASMVLAMAAVLDGAIFGDHCSPISDTTVLSSICSGCDHLQHVRTQLPYAFFGAVVAGIFGYGLVGVLGVYPWLGMLAGSVAILSSVYLVGRSVGQTSSLDRTRIGSVT